jgi:hypothetical protein
MAASGKFGWTVSVAWTSEAQSGDCIERREASPLPHGALAQLHDRMASPDAKSDHCEAFDVGIQAELAKRSAVLLSGQ